MGDRLTVAPVTDNATWQVVGASVTGLAHLTRSEAGQDAWSAAVEGSVLIVAVADGAGSALRGGQGATVCVEAAVAAVSAAIEDGPRSDLRDRAEALAAGAVAAARMAVEFTADLLAARLEEEPRAALASLASTLAVVVATPTWVATAMVGDAAVVIEGPDGLSAMAAVQRGEYLNETTFVASPNWAEDLRVDVRDGPVEGLAAFTDGLQLLALDLASGRPHEPFFKPLFSFATDKGADGHEELAGFLSSPRVVERTDDDCTLVLAVPACARGDHTN